MRQTADLPVTKGVSKAVDMLDTSYFAGLL